MLALLFAGVIMGLASYFLNRNAVGGVWKRLLGFPLVKTLSGLAHFLLAVCLAPLSLSAQAALPEPDYPVIFIHGVNSESEGSWGEFRRVLVENGWVYGGATRYEHPSGDLADPGSVKVWKDAPDSRTDLNSGSGPAHFYTVNFSNNHTLTFGTQGFELGRIVKAVLNANPDKTKVILVGHSMGGLAARAYLQRAGGFYLHATPFNEDVQALITVGTPHQGAMEAKKCQVTLGAGSPICWFKHSSSKGPTSLNPESEAFVDLNNYDKNQKQVSPINLPNSVAYSSIVVTWPPTKTLSDLVFDPILGIYDTIYGDDGDGIVTAKSQDLENLEFSPGINRQTQFVKFPASPPSGCGFHIGVVNEVHTCETSWPEVWDKLLRSVFGIPGTADLTPLVSTGSVTRLKDLAGLQQTSIRGLVFHSTNWVQVTCRYGPDKMLPAPSPPFNTTTDILSHASTDISVHAFKPGTVHQVECIIPDSTVTMVGGNLSNTEMQPLYFRLISSFTAAPIP